MMSFMRGSWNLSIVVTWMQTVIDTPAKVDAYSQCRRAAALAKEYGVTPTQPSCPSLLLSFFGQAQLVPFIRSSSTMPRKYTVHALPQDLESVSSFAGRYASMLLHALQHNPGLFQNRYQDECGRNEADWAAHLTDPTAHRLICVAQTPDDDSSEPLKDGVWVGLLTLRGPLEPELLEFAGRRVGLRSGSGSGGGSAPGAPAETRWSLLGLYVQPEHRSRAVMISIHEAILDFLRTYTDEHVPVVMDAAGLESPRSARLCGTVKAANEPLQRLYQALGAQEVGRMTHAEKLRLRGEVNVADRTGEAGEEPESVVYETVIAC